MASALLGRQGYSVTEGLLSQHVWNQEKDFHVPHQGNNIALKSHQICRWLNGVFYEPESKDNTSQGWPYWMLVQAKT